MDCRELQRKTGKSAEDYFIDECGLALNNGAVFGEGGSGFMRMNVGCTEKMMDKILSRFK